MFKKILLPFDGLKTTMPSARYAIHFAKHLDATVYVLHVISLNVFNSAKSCLGKPDSDVKKYCIGRTKSLFDDIKYTAAKAGFQKIEFIVMFADSVASGVLSAVKSKNADLCIIQPSPYYHSELTGDLASRISKQLNIPTLFVKSKGVLKKNAVILAPVDEKKENLVSVKAAAAITACIKGKLLLYHTTWRAHGLNIEEPIKHCDPGAVECIRLAEAIAKKEGVPFETIVEMEATIEAGVIKCALENEAHLIVMTNSGAHVGGQAELVSDNSMHPLLIVKK